jgi:hypothetical protein
MIKFGFLFSLLAYLFFLGKEYHPLANLKINIAYTHLYDGKDFKCSPSDSGRLHEIKVIMVNDGNDTAKYWMMSCSRSDYFITNNPNISFCREGCRSNVPELIELAPFQQDTFYITLSAKSAISPKFKIGFVLLSGEETRQYNLLTKQNIINKKANTSKIIWSNPIGNGNK